MKKANILLTISLLLTFSMNAIAQGNNNGRQRDGRGPNMDEIFEKRNIYLTKAMGLTAEEAAVFIPLDNELIRKKFESERICRRLERELSNKKEKTDDECKKLLKCKEDAKEKVDKLDKEYLEKFKKILSSEKILKYQRAERDFFEEFFRNRK
jgi:hypothetical protein